MDVGEIDQFRRKFHYVTDIVSIQKPYSSPDESADYEPYTHIDGISVHLNPKHIPRMQIMMVCNEEDLENNVPPD
ncbi:hypothetical protein TVAG_310230 [Trichomonas vaginalis G3]|uniref:Uncharacterized protein n=1 Tax=Trichomonas vaginalis (strain ATCC PRA-98 / G3) TaxID=412133 RepID=A2EKT9_TRIV3|nr:hypothetical protein TVAGG3_0865210 [Trichomonas vaginalis G3]EAY06736.1 hypothetical protein TVAG_310230 [Trichomonas vaginalis G3]KAI5500972.1 hypothetical protein TVAGG3_0865210 [Trichomonas vaginalis G3]|eukprot:XP_001318959.1 hypothetical protein [Trichomonas vaginalis G3]